MAFDAIMKIIRHPAYVKGTIDLGLSETLVQPLGLYLFIGTILYLIPKTSVTGCFLLLAYFGAATATMIIAQLPGHPYLFPIIFAIVAIIGEWLLNPKLRELLPFRK